jgi:hypothetical protein
MHALQVPAKKAARGKGRADSEVDDSVHEVEPEVPARGARPARTAAARAPISDVMSTDGEEDVEEVEEERPAPGRGLCTSMPEVE